MSTDPQRTGAKYLDLERLAELAESGECCVLHSETLDALVRRARTGGSQGDSFDARAEAEINFLNASIAVWREIDKHTVDGVYAAGVPEQLTRDSDLRRTERLAWEHYRNLIDKAEL